MPEQPAKRGKAANPRSTDFNNTWCCQYGVKVAAKENNVVTAADCRFCISFAREEKVGQKRCARKTIQQYQKPYRAENIRKHNEKCHSLKWAEYCALNAEEKDTFFECVVPFVNTTKAHAATTSKSFSFELEEGIVDVIIGELLWRPNEMDGETRENALLIFKEVDASEDRPRHYQVQVPNQLAFELIVDFIGMGMSLRQATDAVTAVKKRTRNPQIGFPTDAKTQAYVRLVCAVNYQLLALVLRRCWAFSLSTDMANCQSTSYISIRIRFTWLGVLYNIQLSALPFFGSHTGEAQFELICKVLNEVFPNWHAALLAVTTDGARNMTGRIRGLVTRLQQVAVPSGFYRVWCPLHQLEIILGAVWTELDCGEYYRILTGIISHLGRQQTLIDEMEAACPLVALTRWSSMHKVSYFLSDRRLEIVVHYNSLSSNAPGRATQPPLRWWILNQVVSLVSGTINEVVRGVQGKRTLLSEQQSKFDELRQSLMLLTDVHVDDDNRQADNDVQGPGIQRGRFRVANNKVAEFVEDTHLFCLEEFSKLSSECSSQLIQAVGGMMLHLVEDMGEIVALRDDSNNASDDEIPPVRPHEMVELSPRAMSHLILAQKTRLLACPGWSESRIQRISTDHRNLSAAYANDRAVKRDLDSCDHSTTFTAAWSVPGIKDKYPHLMDFAGGLATVYPNDGVVESDFSILKYEKDQFRKSMSNLTLHGILACKQYQQIGNIPQ
jgi:hypothetical protein